ncbi:hypothetical protein TSTA_085020 [Talaromyces stipitatus ATCC 10500]|uniref:Integrase catalytic domain-containing protein n=1 Tax=Talaromyces stipitatus (strain ATCC 10500 / CBS 375.48 / QM 6759 / NRRL 1006) TaxID=441959 RepID=B8M0H4_TALSN|nr:uncharacterized protein TSTA_085020 [Talaromyces stipitatus ATCC 10500]EED21271.1 hypothetical protein TSTA_085020 [Talaromyces stipitatus ATCC 10500]
MDENKGTVILKSSNEWRRWLEQLRTKATKERVWDYVNPSPLRTHEVEPAPEKPVKPPFPDSIMPNQNEDPEVEKLALMRFQMELQLYEQHYQRYKDEKARYEKHQERLDAVRSYIFDTVELGHHPRIRMKQTVLEMTQELREEFALQPEQEHELINERYRDLLTPKRGMKPKDWISKWENLLLDMQLTDFNEIPEKRMSRDFIRSSAFIAPKFAESWTTTLIELDTGLEVLHRKIGLDSVPGIRDMIKIFEQWVKAQRNVMDPTRRDASFAMLGGKSDQPEKEEEQKGTQQSNQQTNHQSRSQRKGQSRNRERTCLCGAKHNFEDCPYVNEGKRSKDWKEDEDITRKFKDVERSNTSLAKALKAVKGKLKPTNSTNKKESDDGKKDNEPERSNFVYDEDEVQISIGPRFERSSMAIQVQTIATATDSDKDLKDAVILDNGTTTNIFNDLRRLRNMGNEERICLVGNGSVKMYGPGETIIYPTNPISRQAKKGILVKEAWYVPGMHTNIISQGMAEEYGLFFNGLTRRLVTKKQDICGLKKEGRLYLIEWDENRKPRSSLGNDLALSSFERKVLKDPGNVWHKRLGHISEQAVEKLQEATEGALVTSPRALGRNEEGFKEKCEICELSSAKRQISRVAIPHPTRPFQKVFVDIIVMSLARNGDVYALHLFDPFTKYHALATTPTKSVNFDLQWLIEDVKRTFHVVIEVIHCDGESAINGNDFKDWCKSKRKTLVTTVPNTPEQNGPSERAGGLITTRTRSAIQEANLPTGLWPYVMQAMVYIINRTPTKAIGYKTPYEMAYGKKPYIGNLYLLGSKAYVRINTKKSEKMEPRAQIGYLVGYESHNIWLIWTEGPRGTKVIRARDVFFDETKKYDPEHPFAREIIRNGVTKITESLDIPNLEDFNEERVVESVDEYMNLQQSSSMKFPLEIPVLASGNSQTVTTQQHIPESMEIDDQPVNEPTQSVVIHSDSHLIPSPSASSSTESMQGHQMSTSKELLLENRISEQNQDDKMEIDDVRGQQDNQLVRFDDTKNEVTLYGDESQFGESGRVTGEDSGEEEAQQDEGAERENMALTAGTTTSPSGQIPQIGNEQTPLLQLTNEESRNPDVTLPELLLSTTPQQRSAPKASEIGADLSEGNIVTGPRRRIPSKRARSPEIATSKAERKRHRAFFARMKLLQESSAYKAFLAAAEKLDGYEPLHEDIPPEPRNWIGVKRHRFARQFEEAGRTEMESLKRKGTFEVVDRPEGKQILPLTWVFKYKFDKFGKIAKFKARICVRGDLQKGMDLETRAATLAARIFRMMMALAAVFDLEIVQLDAVNAFVNSDLDEEVYVYFPDGFRIPGKVIRLRKALYGLRQSPRLWQKELTGTLLELGFSQIPDEEKNRQSLFEEIVKKLTSKYEIRQMEKFEWFLNMRIVRDRKQRKIWICQDSYITKIAKKFGLTQNNTKTPISIDLQPSESEAMNEDIHLYQELVGSAMYAAVMTRPDVAKPVNELAKFTTNPSKDHIRQIKRVIEYLYNTRFLAIEFSPPENSDSDVAICASDASFGDNADRTSSEAYIFSLYGGPVDWRATKQRLVTTSTTEAELRAATEAAMKLYVWKRVFKAIGFKTDRELSIRCDNKQTVLLLTREDPHFRTNLRHIDIYHHWLRQEVQCGRLHIEWVPTKEMIADGLTKVLKGQQFLDWRKHQGLTDIAHLVQE